jgi:hypothetical protein
MEHFETVPLFINESRGKEKVFEILSYLANSYELQSRRFFPFLKIYSPKIFFIQTSKEL